MRKKNQKTRLLTGLFLFIPYMKTSLLLLLLLFGSMRASAQEVFSVYYPSGDSKLKEENKQQIQRYIFSHNLKKIDSLQVIGFADSTGKKKLNFRLSQKRADRVKAYLEKILPAKTPVSSYAKGEENGFRNPDENHRRVEIHLFYAGKRLAEDTTDQYEYFGNTKVCFVLSDSVMKNCNIIRVSDGRSNYVILEMEPHLFSKNQTYYTLTKNSQYAKIIKWKLEVSGEGWWQHERYRARIKEADFEAYGVLTKKQIREDDNDCVVCDKDMNAPMKLESELLPETYIMQNLQFRKKLLTDEYLLLVPGTYVSESKSYYFDRNYDLPVTWRTEFGVRNRPYCFAEVPAVYLQRPDWNIYSNRSICTPSGDSVEIAYPVDTMSAHVCFPESRGGVNALEYGLDIGYLNIAERVGYATAYLQYSGTRAEYGINVGIDLKARFIGAIRADYVFFSLDPFKQTVIGNANRSMIHDFHPTLAAYVGSNLSFIGKPANSGLFHAVYLGAAYRNNSISFGLDRLYANFGVSTDYLRPNGLRFHLYLQVGVKFKI